MQSGTGRIGIVGGTGMLGAAIARALLQRGAVAPEALWISNRSGTSVGLDAPPGVTFTAKNQDLADACEVILLSVPPQDAPQIGIAAAGRLVLSVMAGVSLRDLQALTGTDRVVRAMSSPAAALGLAYSPWHAGDAVTPRDCARVTEILGACGTTDRVEREEDIEFFTALTGPVPGFVAFFAAAMADHAVARGISPGIADRAVRQLFLGAGVLMARDAPRPADHLRQMIDYAGTTAAGLTLLTRSDVAQEIGAALDASVDRTRDIARNA